MEKQYSIVPYGAYGLPVQPQPESIKYPEGLSGSFWQYVAGGLIAFAANRFINGGNNNNGSGDKASGISKDFVRLILAISEGEIEGVVDDNGNTGGSSDYRPLQGVYIDKTPIQNPNPDPTFNFREEEDDGNLKENTSIDFKYVRGDISQNLQLADEKNILVIGTDTISAEIAYQQSETIHTATVNIPQTTNIATTDVFEYGADLFTLNNIQVTSSSALSLFVGSEIVLTIDRNDNDYDVPVIITALSSTSMTVSGLKPYGRIRVVSQTTTISASTPIATSGYVRYISGIKTNNITSLKVKISLVLQRIDSKGNPLKDKIRFTISKQDQVVPGGAFSGEEVIIDREFDARYPTETFFDYTIPINPDIHAVNIIIRRLTPPQNQEDGGAQTKQLKLVSITQISSDRIAYLNTAIAHMQFPAKIIQNSPQIWIKVAGIKIDIPNNCAVTSDRGLTASGGWNGGFYTPNKACADPVWILWHLLTEPRYYIAIEPQYIDKFKLYEISLHNNQTVSDGQGGQERRHLFHGILGAGGQTNLFEMIRSVCASMNVKPYWNGSMLSFWQDKKEAFGALPRILGNADVENGQFTYTSQEFQSTTTVAKVTYQSIQDDWENNEEIIEDPLYIARYGYHTEEFALLGETRRSAAVRAGRKIIIDSLPTNVQVAMIVRPHALFFNPGDVVQIADAAKTKIRQAGLVKSAAIAGGNTLIYPDYFPAQLSNTGNKVILLLPDGTRTERTFTSSGDDTHFIISGALPLLPQPGASWLIVDSQIPVQKYRIISVEPEGESQMMFKVVGTTYNEGKYAYIEDGITFPDLIPIPRLPAFMTPIDPGTVDNPKIRLELIAIGTPMEQIPNSSPLVDNSNLDQAFVRSLQTSYTLVANWSPWEPPPGTTVNYLSHYLVEYRVTPGSEWTGRQITKEPTAKWDNLGYSPFYNVRIATVSINGKTSAFVQFGAVNNDRMKETANLASRGVINIENTVYNARDGILSRTQVMENFVYGEVVLDINSPESIVIQVILAFLGRATTNEDISNLITTALIGYDVNLQWYQQRQVYYNVAAEIATDYSSEVNARYQGESNQRILELIYDAAFNRAPDPIGLEFWSNQLSGGQTLDSLIVDIIFAAGGNQDGVTFRSKVSKLGLGTYRPIVIIQLFIALTGINPTVSQVQSYSNFSPFTYLAIANAIHANTNAFVGDTNTQILNKIYFWCFDREPDPEGLAFWSNRLSGGQTIPSLIVDIIFAASGNLDGDTFNNKVYEVFNQYSYLYRSGGMIHQVEEVENDLYGNYDITFESPENLRGLRKGEEGAIASLFGASAVTQVDNNGVSKQVYTPRKPDTPFKAESPVTIGEIAVNYGGLIDTVYGVYQPNLGMRSGVLPTLFGLVSDGIYEFAPNQASTGNIAIQYGGIVNAIYAGNFNAAKANTGILVRLDDIDTTILEIQNTIQNVIVQLQLYIQELEQQLIDKQAELNACNANSASLSSALSSTQSQLNTANNTTIPNLQSQLQAALDELDSLQNPPPEP